MADNYDITIEQGADLSIPITWRNSAGALIDLTNYTARMKIKDSLDGDTLVSLTQADGLVLGGVAGTVTITRTAAQTILYTWPRGVYDLELVTAGGVVTRLLEGQVIVKREVTN